VAHPADPRVIQKNILANLAGRAWGFISVYLFVPLYLQFLGVEAYGLIGFFSALLGVLALADMGLTSTLNREMARLSVRKDTAGEMRDLLRTYETAYLGVSLGIALLIWALGPLIAEYWLRSNVLQPSEIIAAIRLMGAAIALQLPAGLYIGGLMGLQKQVLTNSLQIVWGAFRGGGAVLILWLFSPTITAFFLWQLVSNAGYCFFTRLALWRVLSPERAHAHPHFQWQLIRNTWRYAAGMTGMTLVSILLTQTDKLVVSKVLSLELLGYYTLAGALGMIPIVLANPIALAVFPRFTGMVARGDRISLAQLYHRACELVAVAIVPAGLTVALFAGDIIRAWTGSAMAAQQAGPVTSLLVAGQLMQAITVVPYYVALAHGNVRLNLQIGVASFIMITPLLILLTMRHGIMGAGLSWLIMNLATTPFYMYFLHRRFLPCELRRWFLRSVARPLLATLPCILLGRYLWPDTSSRWLTFCLVGLAWGIAVTATAATVPEVRDRLTKATLRLLGVFHAA